MSKHRVKTIAVDDDYDDGYDYDEEYGDGAYAEDDEISPEDKEKLRIGTAQVRSALGQGFPSTSDKEIQDTLWHYYYDVGKSVTFLKNQHTPTPKRQEKLKSEKANPQATAYLMRTQVPWSTQASGLLGSYHLAPSTAKDFFKDSPWLNIPQHRKADILIEPIFPRFGLLGGSSGGEGKMSKLAALAAKRRQKENEKQQNSNANLETSVEDSASSLSKPRIEPKHKTSHPNGTPSRLRKNIVSGSSNKTNQEPSFSEQDPPATMEKEPRQGKDDDDERDHCALEADIGDLRAKPSSFARVLVDFPDTASSFPPKSSAPLKDSFITPFDFTKPSPDDVVLKAQNFKGSKSSTPSKQQKPIKTMDSVRTGVKDLSISEPEKVKSKNLDVLAEYRKVKRKNALNFVVIGHVDSGKSTLMGRLLFDLKVIDERTIEKYKREAGKMGRASFAFAWVLDQGSEERARGVTIDIAANKFETDRTAFTVLDAPGHRDFVPNMIAGASQADFAVLVIDASPGEFEAGLRGQTKEHALLARSIGISRIIMAVNKMDRTDWSQERFRDIQQQMSAFLATAGFKKENISFVPCSGLEGDYILNRSTHPKANWYSGRTLVEELDNTEPRDHALDKPLRMTIDDIFESDGQSGISIAGRIEAGSLQVGDQVMIMSGGEKTFVKNIRVDEEPSDWAVAGQNVVLDIAEVEEAKIKSGDVLCSVASPARSVSSFTAKVLAFEHLTPMPLSVHRGRLHVPGKITQMVAILDKADGSVIKKKPKIVQPGSVARVVVDLEDPAPIEDGRIILRAGGETVATGLLE